MSFFTRRSFGAISQRVEVWTNTTWRYDSGLGITVDADERGLQLRKIDAACLFRIAAGQIMDCRVLAFVGVIPGDISPFLKNNGNLEYDWPLNGGSQLGVDLLYDSFVGTVGGAAQPGGASPSVLLSQSRLSVAWDKDAGPKCGPMEKISVMLVPMIPVGGAPATFDWQPMMMLSAYGTPGNDGLRSITRESF